MMYARDGESRKLNLYCVAKGCLQFQMASEEMAFVLMLETHNSEDGLGKHPCPPIT